MKAVLILGLLMSITSQAATQYDQYFTDSSGKRLEASEALMSSVKGEAIYKCQTVEGKISKSGTSIGLRNVKKPKVVKND